MVTVVAAAILWVQAAEHAKHHRSCPKNLEELADRIGELRADYPELGDFVSHDALVPVTPVHPWPAISFIRGFDIRPTPAGGGRTETVMRGKYPVSLVVRFIPPVERDAVSPAPDGPALGWCYIVKVRTRDSRRASAIFGEVTAVLQAAERCGPDGRPLPSDDESP